MIANWSSIGRPKNLNSFGEVEVVVVTFLDAVSIV
jgi:hypothetical protein